MVIRLGNSTSSKERVASLAHDCRVAEHMLSARRGPLPLAYTFVVRVCSCWTAIGARPVQFYAFVLSLWHLHRDLDLVVLSFHRLVD